MPDDWQTFQERVEAAHRAVEAYNKRIQEINTTITELKQPRRQDDLNSAKVELQRLHQTKKRHETAVVKDCTSLTTEMNRKQQMETQKATTRTQLDQYCQIEPFSLSLLYIF